MRWWFLACIVVISCRESLVDSRDVRFENELIGSWILDNEWPESHVTVRLHFKPDYTVRIDNTFVGHPVDYRFWVDDGTLYLSRRLDDDTTEEFDYDIIQLDDDDLVLEYRAGGGIVQRKFNRL